MRGICPPTFNPWGIGRFVTALRAAQAAAPGAVLTVSAGNQIAPGKALAVSLETGAEFYDVRAVEQVGYDFIGVGSRDLSLSRPFFRRLRLIWTPPFPR